MFTENYNSIQTVTSTQIDILYISDTQIAKRYGVSRQTVWRWSATDITFPTPIKLSAGCTRWKLTDLEEWELIA